LRRPALARARLFVRLEKHFGYVNVKVSEKKNKTKKKKAHSTKMNIQSFHSDVPGAFGMRTSVTVTVFVSTGRPADAARWERSDVSHVEGKHTPMVMVRGCNLHS
jgi:hypothetical protein